MYIPYPFATLIWLMVGAGLGVAISGWLYAGRLRKLRRKIALLEKENEKLNKQVHNFWMGSRN